MRVLALAFATAILLPMVPLSASEPLVMTPDCEGNIGVRLFLQWDTQLENLAFDGAGSLYLSDIGGDRLLKADSAGNAVVVDHVPGMHGMVFGPDGLLYIGATAEDGTAGVWVYSSLAPPVRHFLFGGLEAANGMAFDQAGNLYVSSPLGTRAPYLVRSAAPYHSWTPWTTEYGMNGLVLDTDGSLVAAVTADQSSPILRISTSDPNDVQTIARLTFGAATLQPGLHAPAGPPVIVPKGLDDLTLGEDGLIYAAAHVTGELLRVDPATGEACVLMSFLQEPTSVRIAEGFGSWDGWIFVTDMGGQAVTALAGPGEGAVFAVHVSG